MISASGTKMQANTGSGLYIRKGHEDAFKTAVEISASSNAKWMPVTGYSSTALTTADKFTGSFGVLSGISSTDTKTLEYTAVTGATAETGTDAYTATVNGTEGCGVYYHFELDYMITAGKKLKVTAKDVTAKKDGTAVSSGPTIAQATRVGVIEAESVTKTGDQMTDASYKAEGKEYLVAEAAPADTDYNYEELKALGYTGNSEYKTGLTALYGETGVTFTPTSTTTSDGAFEYGSLSIYVWFDGTDYSCTNAIFSQTLDLTLSFTVAD